MMTERVAVQAAGAGGSIRASSSKSQGTCAYAYIMHVQVYD